MSFVPEKTTYTITDFTINGDVSRDKLLGSTAIGFVADDKGIHTGIGIGELYLPKNMDGSEDTIVDYSYLGDSVDSIVAIGDYKGVAYVSNDNYSQSLVDRSIFFYGSDGMVYPLHYYAGFDPTLLLSDTSVYGDKPVVFSYAADDVAYVWISAGDMNLRWNFNALSCQTFTLPYKLTSICRNDDILYAITDDVGQYDDDALSLGRQDTVRYTATQDPSEFNTDEDTDITVAGNIKFIDERGACKKLISYKGYVYVFREYGITKLSRLSSGTHVMYHLYSSPSRIYQDTIRMCGDNIIFMTRNGIYEFNGTSVYMMDTAFNDLLDNTDNTYACADTIGDYYVLACHIDYDDYNDECKNNSLVRVNIESGEWDIMRGVDISSIITSKDISHEKVLLTFNNDNSRKIGQMNDDGMYYDESSYKEYITNTIEVDVDGNASRVMDIVISTTNKCSITMIVDGIREYNYDIKKSGVSTVHPCAVARTVQLKITTTEGQIDIDSISIRCNEM